jgi:hypothetical protein
MLVLVQVFGAAFLPSAFAAPPSVPAGSFLGARASTTDELVSQVASSDAVRALYARHFGIDQSEVISRLKALRPMLLNEPIKVRYYFLNKDNIVDKVITLPRATAVFASSDGVPMLSWPYGNPLGGSKPSTLDKGNTPIPASGKADSTLAGTSDSAGRSSDAIPGIVSGPTTGTQTTGSNLPQQPAGSVVLADATPMVSLPNPTLVGAAPAATSHGIATSTILAGIGGLAGVIGAVAAFSGDSSHPSSVNTPNPPLVPEPQALTVLALGLLGVGGFLRRKH